MYNILSKYIKEIPYEGQEVDIHGIEDFIDNLLKGFIIFSHKFIKTNKGYLLDSKYYTRDEIVQLFKKQTKLT